MDLDEDPSNGCESDCAVTNDGVEACDGNDNDCDGIVDEGFDLTSDAAHCGTCNVSCLDLSNVATGACVASVCQVETCEAGFFDLDESDVNGCEYACSGSVDATEVCDETDNDCDGAVDEGFDLQSDANHCGTCNTACADLANASAVVCATGLCQVTSCEAGFYNLDGADQNGCEYACREPWGHQRPATAAITTVMAVLMKDFCLNRSFKLRCL